MIELNLEGLPGPTHHFGGLGIGNMASQHNANTVSSPRRAALQSIEKMKKLLDFGVVVGVLPPHPRPYRVEGREVFSSSFMWTANAATVTSSIDSTDRKTHFTPANLVSNFHRSAEALRTQLMLKAIFNNGDYFVVHDPVPPSYPDEGAANWTRLSSNGPGLYIGVYGRSIEHPMPLPRTIVPRQSKEALRWIGDTHGLDRTSLLLFQQSPAIIEAGVFHNDVIATGIGSLYLMHERAYTQSFSECVSQINEVIPDATVVGFSDYDLTISEAVDHYWFNSQLIQTHDGDLLMMAPKSCKTLSQIQRLQKKVYSAGVSHIEWIDLDESLKNGGGPACVRLRVPLELHAIDAVHAGIIMTHKKLAILDQWVRRWYRDSLSVAELKSPQLHTEASRALVELGDILNLADLFKAPYN